MNAIAKSQQSFEDYKDARIEEIYHEVMVGESLFDAMEMPDAEDWAKKITQAAIEGQYIECGLLVHRTMKAYAESRAKDIFEKEYKEMEKASEQERAESGGGYLVKSGKLYRVEY